MKRNKKMEVLVAICIVAAIFLLKQKITLAVYLWIALERVHLISFIAMLLKKLMGRINKFKKK